MRSLLIVISTGIFLSGCGVVYNSPSVSKGRTDAGVDVDVVPLTFSSADFANRLAPYTPRPLPPSMKTAGAPQVLATTTRLRARLTDQQRKAMQDQWPAAIPPQPYRLGVGDLLLFSPPTGTGSVIPGASASAMDSSTARRVAYAVQDDGAVSIPDTGRVRVVGKTLPQVEQAIFQALLERQKDPNFSIEVAEFNSQSVDVAGEVQKPGAVPITLRPLYLRDAMAAAGGSAVPDAQDAIVTLHRDGETYRMMLSDIYSEPDLGRRVLKDGDSIIVGSLDSLALGSAALSNELSLFQAQASARSNDRQALKDQMEIGSLPRDYVYLMGEVKKQTRIGLPFGMTESLADVLFDADAGGFKLETANVSQIYVLRFGKLSGRVTAYHLDGRNAASFVVATALQMRPNDFVFIAEQPVTKWNRVVQQITPFAITSVSNAATN